MASGSDPLPIEPRESGPRREHDARRGSGGRLVAHAALLVVVSFAGASSARAGAESRGGLGHFYLKTFYATQDGSSGFDEDGNEASLTSPVFLDRLTSALAVGDGHYEETDFGLYAEIGLLERLDLLVAMDWKEIEKRFTLGGFGFTYPLTQSSSGFGDVMAGLKYQFLAAPFPVATDVSVRVPTYSTSVRDLHLETINVLDDEIALGNGTTDLALGLSASSGPMIPWMFADARVAYVLADLDAREFSDRVEWETKVGGSRWGLGAAAFVGGAVSTQNGGASDTITQDLLFLDPRQRVTVLNDQEWLQVGGQLWYAWEGIGIQVGYSATVAGSNTTKTDRLEVALFASR